MAENTPQKIATSVDFESKQGLEVYHDRVLNSNIERWLPLVEQVTFKTTFVPITREEAASFIASYQAYDAKSDLTDDDAANLARLTEKLQLGIDSLMQQTGCTGVFVKTSSRSAKDACEDRLVTNYRQICAERLPANDNERMQCLMQAGVQALRVSNAKEAMAMLSRSERIAGDMSIALEHTDRFEENLVIREWVDIDAGFEFRGFACNGKLNGLSQYNYTVFYPQLVPLKDQIAADCQTVFNEQVAPQLVGKVDACVIDFAWVNGRVWVIELNPFFVTTDQALFRWDKDAEVLQNGPFEMRIVMKQQSGMKSQLPRHLRDVIEGKV
eukprot:TRINITY_DN13463_c0_g1_i1.p1 TRINITY_DN13463_c0_g1~~TRINITY_DN13463_c0_g1_i1.p1  ORF type:complete len:327 (+),score=71.37 TRINITY_DN13463_c0_g1_i1:53-1033(+)